ncbi:hypothetical protein ACLE20_00710 [Rhizobium sp. YIM 134829]|uniref:hypothetical protein n=1 Tax=Rhizobium sp. YIM 134829 TaxID=3390453 RepID=UPI00397BE2ED
MTALLDYAMETARTLPPERQDEIARMVLAYASDEDLIHLTPEEDADLREAQAEMQRGEFATNEEVEAVLSKFRA